MPYSAAIFDLDGTLLDTLDDLCACMNHALVRNGLEPRSNDEIRMAVGNGIEQLVSSCLPSDASTELAEAVRADFSMCYHEHARDTTKPYPGIPALLRHLRTRGIRCAVISNKPDDAVQQLVGSFFPGELDIALGEREAEGIKRKPAPDALNEVVQQLGLKKRDVVYIGDSEVDIETATHAQCACISVSWGFRSQSCLEAHGASCIAESVEELERLIIEEA